MSGTEIRKSSPGTPQLRTLVEQGYSLMRQGHFDKATALAARLVDAHPGDPHALVFASEAQLALNAPDAALELIDKAIQASHGNPLLKIKKAHLLLQLRRRKEAAEVAAQASSQAHANGPATWQIGNIYNGCNLPADALAQYEQAHRLMGEHPGLLYDMAVVRFFIGDFAGAEANLNTMLGLNPQAGHALYLRSTLRRQTLDHNHINELDGRLKRGFSQPAAEAAALYALAKEQEDLGKGKEAFSALSRAAAKKRSTLQYDVATECASLQAICSVYTDGAMQAPVAGHDEEGAIFIVGMPRTGTTLVERMLVQQGKVKSAGELLDFGSLLAAATAKCTAPGQLPANASLGIDFAALGRDYMEGARQAAGGWPWFIDKMPINYLYCGMIHKALPKARIIHLMRDPLDTCYAVYKTLFFNAYHFSYDLAELGDYYIAYRRMMQHWHDVMPGHILDVNYEDLVADIEGQSKRIYEWCGLEWSREVTEAPTGRITFATASAAQVREPVHSRSVHSSRKYREQLAPLVSKLAAAGFDIDKQPEEP